MADSSSTTTSFLTAKIKLAHVILRPRGGGHRRPRPHRIQPHHRTMVRPSLPWSVTRRRNDQDHPQRLDRPWGPRSEPEQFNRSPGGSSNISLMSSFRYKKGGDDTKDKLAYDSECSVCLSGFEEGDEVRQLPTCKHCFHASCIDMWLYSHSDCPLCRAAVGPPPVVLISRPTDTTSQLEHSREGLLNPTINGSV